MTCEELEELSGAYVLDAITPEERQEVDEHLAQCSNCTQLIKELRSVVDLLPLTVPQVDPSPALKERILAAISDKNTSTAQATRPIPITARPPAERPTPIRRQPQPIRRRSAWQRWGVPVVAAAAVLFLLLSGGLTAWNISLQHQQTSLQQQNIALQQRVNGLSGNAPTTYSIKGLATSSNITGTVTYFPQQDITVMKVRGLRQTQGTQVYQGWLLQGKQPVSIGLFNIQKGIATIDYPGNVRQFDAAAVSIEAGPQATPLAPKGPVLAEGLIKKSA